MGLFGSGKSNDPPIPPRSQRESAIPILQFDLNLRYDLYLSEVGHDRLYENVRIVGMRTFEALSEFGSNFGAYLELESADGGRMMIPHYGIRIVCEHGAKPKFRVLRHGRHHGDD